MIEWPLLTLRSMKSIQLHWLPIFVRLKKKSQQLQWPIGCENEHQVTDEIEQDVVPELLRFYF